MHRWEYEIHCRLKKLAQDNPIEEEEIKECYNSVFGDRSLKIKVGTVLVIRFESEIDHLVYLLYSLTESDSEHQSSEIKFVE